MKKNDKALASFVDFARKLRSDLHKALKSYKTEEAYRDARASIELVDSLFLVNGKPTPNTKEYADLVLKKVILLNYLFLTHIQMTEQGFLKMVEAISSVKNIDDRIASRDTLLIEDIIAEYQKRGGRREYCFVTKYCHMHNNNYPIYDSKVSSVLYTLLKKGCINITKISMFESYPTYTATVNDFLSLYGIDFRGRDLDKALFVYSKETPLL